MNTSSPKTRWLSSSTMKAAFSISAMVMVLFFLLRSPITNDEALLPFDSRLWPPFSAMAPAEVYTHRANMIYSDLPGWMMPERLVTLEMSAQGIAPLWTPYTLGGTPLLASLVYPVYYPVHLALNFIPELDPFKALSLQTFLNLVLAGLGM
ncbi:MAG: hypothetical protein ABIK28_24640, partial [Planctomycetota bacterium]